MIAEDCFLKTLSFTRKLGIGARQPESAGSCSPGPASIQFSGNDGCWVTSLIKSNSRAENSESEEAVIVVESASLPRPRVPPIERSSSLICLLVRVSVPSFATARGNLSDAGMRYTIASVVADR